MVLDVVMCLCVGVESIEAMSLATVSHVAKLSLFMEGRQQGWPCLVVLSVTVPVDHQLLLLRLLFVPEPSVPARSYQQIPVVVVHLVVSDRPGPVSMAAVLTGRVLKVVPVRVNQERVVNPQNQLVTKDANIFQKQQNQYQTHTNVLFWNRTRARPNTKPPFSKIYNETSRTEPSSVYNLPKRSAPQPPTYPVQSGPKAY